MPIRHWTEGGIKTFEIELLAAIHNPGGVNMVDLGFELLNCVREDLGLTPMSKDTLSEGS